MRPQTVLNLRLTSEDTDGLTRVADAFRHALAGEPTVRVDADLQTVDPLDPRPGHEPGPLTRMVSRLAVTTFVGSLVIAAGGIAVAAGSAAVTAVQAAARGSGSP